MEKKFKFSENPNASKIIYGAVIALLCITAIIVGIVAASNRNDTVDNNPPVTDGEGNNDGTGDNTGNNEDDGTQNGSGDNQPPEKQTFIFPVVGTVAKGHSTTVPVYSVTLEEWRIHTGIDISCAEGADVFAAAAGTVTAVKQDPLLGKTVEITHEDGIVTVYSNLANEGLVAEGKTVLSGERIGFVGDTTISELADEPHLHFEMLENGKRVNPLDYIDEDAKRVSLGITQESAA